MWTYGGKTFLNINILWIHAHVLHTLDQQCVTCDKFRMVELWVIFTFFCTLDYPNVKMKTVHFNNLENNTAKP